MDDRILVSNRRHSAQVTVKQKELHKKEAEYTINELFDITKAKSDAFYLKQLYYFCYSTNRGDTSLIKSELDKKGVKINLFKKFRLKTKIQLRKFLKSIYHKLK